MFPFFQHPYKKQASDRVVPSTPSPTLLDHCATETTNSAFIISTTTIATAAATSLPSTPSPPLSRSPSIHQNGNNINNQHHTEVFNPCRPGVEEGTYRCSTVDATRVPPPIGSSTFSSKSPSPDPPSPSPLRPPSASSSSSSSAYSASTSPSPWGEQIKKVEEKMKESKERGSGNGEGFPVAWQYWQRHSQHATQPPPPFTHSPQQEAPSSSPREHPFLFSTSCAPHSRPSQSSSSWSSIPTSTTPPPLTGTRGGRGGVSSSFSTTPGSRAIPTPPISAAAASSTLFTTTTASSLSLTPLQRRLRAQIQLQQQEYPQVAHEDHNDHDHERKRTPSFYHQEEPLPLRIIKIEKEEDEEGEGKKGDGNNELQERTHPCHQKKGGKDGNKSPRPTRTPPLFPVLPFSSSPSRSGERVSTTPSPDSIATTATAATISTPSEKEKERVSHHHGGTCLLLIPPSTPPSATHPFSSLSSSMTSTSNNNNNKIQKTDSHYPPLQSSTSSTHRLRTGACAERMESAAAVTMRLTRRRVPQQPLARALFPSPPPSFITREEGGRKRRRNPPRRSSTHEQDEDGSGSGSDVKAEMETPKQSSPHSCRRSNNTNRKTDGGGRDGDGHGDGVKEKEIDEDKNPSHTPCEVSPLPPRQSLEMKEMYTFMVMEVNSDVDHDEEEEKEVLEQEREQEKEEAKMGMAPFHENGRRTKEDDGSCREQENHEDGENPHHKVSVWYHVKRERNNDDDDKEEEENENVEKEREENKGSSPSFSSSFRSSSPPAVPPLRESSLPRSSSVATIFMKHAQRQEEEKKIERGDEEQGEKIEEKEKNENRGRGRSSRGREGEGEEEKTSSMEDPCTRKASSTAMPPLTAAATMVEEGEEEKKEKDGGVDSPPPPPRSLHGYHVNIRPESGEEDEEKEGVEVKEEKAPAPSLLPPPEQPQHQSQEEEKEEERTLLVQEEPDDDEVGRHDKSEGEKEQHKGETDVKAIDGDFPSISTPSRRNRNRTISEELPPPEIVVIEEENETTPPSPPPLQSKKGKEIHSKQYSISSSHSCRYADQPPRYRDAPCYCCSYCCFTACVKCFHTIIAPHYRKPSSSSSSSEKKNDEEKAAAAAVADSLPPPPPQKQQEEQGGGGSSHNEEDAEGTADWGVGSGGTTTKVSHNNNTTMCTPPSPSRFRHPRPTLQDPLSAQPEQIPAIEEKEPKQATRKNPSWKVSSYPTSSYSSSLPPSLSLFYALQSSLKAGSARKSSSSSSSSSLRISSLSPFPPAATTATPSPASSSFSCPLCNGQGKLHYTRVLEIAWCCEGRQVAEHPKRYWNSSSGGSLFDMNVLQRYYSLKAVRAQRGELPTSTLVGTFLSSTPPTWSGMNSWKRQNRGEGEEWTRQVQRRIGMEGEANERKRSREDAEKKTKERSPDDGGGKTSASSSSFCFSTATTPPFDGLGQRPRCEEGGSFTFSLHNPRLDTTLVWCAVNRVLSRENHSAWLRSSSAGGAGMVEMDEDPAPSPRDHHREERVGKEGEEKRKKKPSLPPPPPSAGSFALTSFDFCTITPLLEWVCSPSLPGLPPRVYEVKVPHLAYIGKGYSGREKRKEEEKEREKRKTMQIQMQAKTMMKEQHPTMKMAIMSSSRSSNNNNNNSCNEDEEEEKEGVVVMSMPPPSFGYYSTPIQALALYAKSDLFRKTFSTLQQSSSSGLSSTVNHHHHNGGGSGLRMVNMSPASQVRPLLVVEILHHVASSPRPFFSGWERNPGREENRNKEKKTKREWKKSNSDTHYDNIEEEAKEKEVRRREEKEEKEEVVGKKRSRMEDPPCSKHYHNSDNSIENKELPFPPTTERIRGPTPPPPPTVEWPFWCSPVELRLCLDHLSHGRSVGVFGLGSKFPFLQHVLQSAELKNIPRFVIDGVRLAAATASSASSSRKEWMNGGGGRAPPFTSMKKGGSGTGSTFGNYSAYVKGLLHDLETLLESGNPVYRKGEEKTREEERKNEEILEEAEMEGMATSPLLSTSLLPMQTLQRIKESVGNHYGEHHRLSSLPNFSSFSEPSPSSWSPSSPVQLSTSITTQSKTAMEKEPKTSGKTGTVSQREEKQSVQPAQEENNNNNNNKNNNNVDKQYYSMKTAVVVEQEEVEKKRNNVRCTPWSKYFDAFVMYTADIEKSRRCVVGHPPSLTPFRMIEKEKQNHHRLANHSDKSKHKNGNTSGDIGEEKEEEMEKTADSSSLLWSSSATSILTATCFPPKNIFSCISLPQGLSSSSTESSSSVSALLLLHQGRQCLKEQQYFGLAEKKIRQELSLLQEEEEAKKKEGIKRATVTCELEKEEEHQQQHQQQLQEKKKGGEEVMVTGIQEEEEDAIVVDGDRGRASTIISSSCSLPSFQTSFLPHLQPLAGRADFSFPVIFQKLQISPKQVRYGSEDDDDEKNGRKRRRTKRREKRSKQEERKNGKNTWQKRKRRTREENFLPFTCTSSHREEGGQEEEEEEEAFSSSLSPKILHFSRLCCLCSTVAPSHIRVCSSSSSTTTTTTTSAAAAAGVGTGKGGGSGEMLSNHKRNIMDGCLRTREALCSALLELFSTQVPPRRHRCVQWLPHTAPYSILSCRRDLNHNHRSMNRSSNGRDDGNSPPFPSLPSSTPLPPSCSSSSSTSPASVRFVILAIQRIDLLNDKILSEICRLCSLYASPPSFSSSSPTTSDLPPPPVPLQLQLLVSFDDPSWPHSSAFDELMRRKGGVAPLPYVADSHPVSASSTLSPTPPPPPRYDLMRAMAFVHLTSAWFPRLEEQKYLLPPPSALLLEYESASNTAGAAAAEAISTGAAGTGDGRSYSGTKSGVKGKGITGSMSSIQATIRRVLWSIPFSFCALFRSLIQAQLEVGEGEYISVFLLLELLEEQSGMLISQGRWRALQKELTSNRLALYDPGEHALMIPQPQQFLKVLEEVVKEREGQANGGHSPVME